MAAAGTTVAGTTAAGTTVAGATVTAMAGIMVGAAPGVVAPAAFGAIHIVAGAFAGSMLPSQRGFSKASTVVLPSTVLACTKDCAREDCHVSCKNLEDTRSVVSIFYGKDGTMKFENGGQHRTYVACRSCRREWVVEQTENEIQAVHALQNLYDR